MADYLSGLVDELDPQRKKQSDPLEAGGVAGPRGNAGLGTIDVNGQPWSGGTWNPTAGAYDMGSPGAQSYSVPDPSNGAAAKRGPVDMAASPNLPVGGVPSPESGGMASAPDYTKLGKYANQLTGYDMNKFNRPYDQMSEKYKVGLVNSWFDPNQGITPEYLKALNDLNIGDFSGTGDKLNVMNGRNGGRYGQGGTADTIVGLKSG